MPNLYQINTSSEGTLRNFTEGEITSVAYHDIFDYPLTMAEMIRWSAGKYIKTRGEFTIIEKSGYFFKEGKEGLIYKRTLRSRNSERKFKIAKEASQILSLIPSVKMVGVTGSLAMSNASDDNDIDLMVITGGGCLWTTRLLSHLFIKLAGFKVRKAGDKNQKDKLCLNIWMSENDLIWRKNRNLYTAHEIAQIQPLVNKNSIYEKFIYENRWVKNFWPNALKTKYVKTYAKTEFKINIIEKLAFHLQYRYMKSKISRETITPTRALFHPQDWSKTVLSRLAS